MKLPFALAGILALAIALPACSVVQASSQVRGNKVDEDSLKELHPGVSTRADATSLLGSPTARATFDDNTWLYIQEVTRPRIGAFQAVLNQKVVVLAFDEKGVLRDIRQLDQKDALPVDVVSRATPSPGSSASFMQQLLGNVGRFNTGAAPGQNAIPGGAGPLAQ